MAYANAMRELTQAYPDDLDVATLSAGEGSTFSTAGSAPTRCRMHVHAFREGVP